ncbi:hypothetical protein TZ00_03145 [Agreia bicolorata]|uniref:Uncharacterized protein n=2 Tax=Agreia bicolorata TaxID=110935 RepID=A0ABR5CJH7_9MICO|nr:hypothetical protein TZ00_03145 [Agreia bicolorata]
MGRGERSDNTWGRAANTLNVEDIETVGDISNVADTLASVPIPADDGVASISVFYVVGDRVGSTRAIVPSFR